MKHCTTIIVVLLGVMAACSGNDRSAAAEDPCASSRRDLLLAQDLDEAQLSAEVDVPGDVTLWIRVTKRPTSAGGLLGELAGVAELHRVAAGAEPSITTDDQGNRQSQDPSIVLQQALRWQQVDMPPGRWRLYSFSNPAIEVLACHPPT